MNQVAIVTYQVKSGKTEENREFIDQVFAKLKAAHSAGVRYASTLAEDGVTFTHIAYFESDEAKTTLTESAEFKAFQKDLKDRCETPPKAQFCQIVGTHNLF